MVWLCTQAQNQIPHDRFNLIPVHSPWDTWPHGQPASNTRDVMAANHPEVVGCNQYVTYHKVMPVMTHSQLRQWLTEGTHLLLHTQSESYLAQGPEYPITYRNCLF